MEYFGFVPFYFIRKFQSISNSMMFRALFATIKPTFSTNFNKNPESELSMERFFKACREPIHPSVLKNFKRHESKISRIALNNSRIETFILPNNISQWPSFVADKQKIELCPEIYFKRIADSNLPRFNATVELLKNGKDVVSTGLSGIGKSTEVNGLLMEFLANVGKVDWPMEVWYRCDGVMTIFSLESGVPCVREVAAKTLADVSELTRPYRTVF
jgi:hypothetical protein